MNPLTLPIPELFLRGAVAFSFLYPPIDALSDPDSWIGYFPGFVLSSGIDPMTLLHTFGAIEGVIALWILFGKNVLWPSVAAAVLLIAIVLVNGIQFPVLFRDVSIALAALALAFMHRPYVARH
ncbi:MAG TPA: hypothetical protein VEA92_03580 [Candidatus Paceibacterota bacterium]|nr:hypothetical protein [Candidatus Paceibacterota bacterium]